MKVGFWLQLQVCVLAVGGSLAVHAQSPTIPETLAREGRDSGLHVHHGSGRPPATAEILLRTSVVARGTIGVGRSYLSTDQRDVLTDYVLTDAVILYERQMRLSPVPGVPPVVTVTQRGGAISVNGLKYAETWADLPPLTPGAEGLFLLESIGDKHLIAGIHYGAFRIANGQLAPMTQQKGFAPEYTGVGVAQATEQILGSLRALDAGR